MIGFGFNLSLSAGVFPAIWKESFVVPLFKSDDKRDVSCYHGISILSVIPKLFEKMVCNSNLVHVHRLVQSFRQGASRSVEVQFINIIWWIAFVLDGVLSDRSDTACQIVGPNLFNVIARFRSRVTWDQYSSFWILTGH
jgi:hypothetical protein